MHVWLGCSGAVAGRATGCCEEAVGGEHGAGPERVHERGGPDRQAAAPEPGPPPRLLRPLLREDARLRVHEQQELGRLHLWYY